MGVNNFAVITVAIGNTYKKVGKLSHPTMRSYADKVGSDFIIIDESYSDLDKRFSPHWAKFKIYDLLKKYDRLIYFDTDIIIRKDCPNLFDEVPEDCIGAFNEGKFSSRQELLYQGEKAYSLNFDHNKHKSDYWNTGVLVVSKKHRQLFKVLKNPIPFPSDYGEQTLVNLRILSDFQIKTYDLKYVFNRMTLMDNLLGEDRLSSYILHYAGCPDPDTLLSVMSRDLSSWLKDSPNYNYKRRVFIDITGGLGDQISAEPTIRYMKKVLYPDDEIYIHTPFSEVFNHLKNDVIFVDVNTNIGDKACARFRTCPLEGEEDPLATILSHPLIHPVDFSSLAVMRFCLPDEYKQVSLEVTKDGLNEVFDIVKDEDLSNVILLHPGKGWDTKTFPVDWWEKVMLRIVSQGKKVGIIGKYLNEDQGYLPVTCPEDSYDFRDLLSLEGLIALISKTPVLITNDSAPLHIAGAFNNWIILIPTCKHPDYLLPYRNGGSKNWKSFALYKDLTCNYISIAPTIMYGGSIDKVYKGSITDYIPEPEEIIQTIEKCR